MLLNSIYLSMLLPIFVSWLMYVVGWRRALENTYSLAYLLLIFYPRLLLLNFQYLWYICGKVKTYTWDTMPQHVCNRCGWIFNRKSNLNQHLTNRKKPCKSTAAVKNNYLSPPYNVPPAVTAIEYRSSMLSRSNDISTLNVGNEKSFTNESKDKLSAWCDY